MLRVVHLFSNHKVTGPAELALDTARAVERYANGSEPVESHFVPGRHPEDPFWLGDLAEQRGARVLRLPGLRLGKHFHPLRSYRDGRVLGRYLRRHAVDLIHCHLPNDHMVASLAVGGISRKSPIPIVRTLYDGEPVRAGWRARRTLRQSCSHLICFSATVKDGLLEGPLKLSPDRVTRLHPPIDTERFDPARRDAIGDGRSALGIPADSFTAGIVARMQPHRHFDVLLEAVRLVRERVPGFRFVIVGRGTHQVRVAREPVERLGLTDTVVFAGYREGDDYVATLLALDVKLFLVPGSDGTCRAVREALAAGIPVVAARRGILPEIVEDGVTGRIVEDTPERLAGALVDLAGDRERRLKMGRAARRAALEKFSYGQHARALHTIYRDVLQRRG